MEHLLHSFARMINVPPVTRIRIIMIIALSILTLTKVILPKHIYFIREKAFSQPWRLITCFCYINSFLIEVVLYLLSCVDVSGYVEEDFDMEWLIFSLDRTKNLDSTKQDRLRREISRHKSYDFLYYQALVGATVIALITLADYMFGRSVYNMTLVFDHILFYLWCNNNANYRIDVFGLFSIRAEYLPWIQETLIWLFRKEAAQDVQRLMSGLPELIKLVFRREVFTSILVHFLVGHFWWFLRDFLLRQYYCEIEKHIGSIPVKHYKSSKLVALMVPPWYWFIFKQMGEER